MLPVGSRFGHGLEGESGKETFRLAADGVPAPCLVPSVEPFLSGAFETRGNNGMKLTSPLYVLCLLVRTQRRFLSLLLQDWLLQDGGPLRIQTLCLVNPCLILCPYPLPHRLFFQPGKLHHSRDS